MLALSPAVAQDQASPAKQPEQTPATAAAPSTTSTPAPKPAASTDTSKAAQDAARFAEFDKLKTQGKTTDYPGVYETLLQDAGGFRTWLYDHNLYFKGTDSATFSADLNGGRSPTSPQVFIGQKSTFLNTLAGDLSWKIGGKGDDITQINIGGNITRTTWQSAGPSANRFATLNLYSSFFNRAVEVKAGINTNLLDFIGIFAGGNPILASGLAGTIPAETGLSSGLSPTPTINITINGKDGLYSKTGIQRSVGADGPTEEAKHNGIGLQFSQPGARTLIIQEFGVRRSSGPDSRQIWLRAGGIYNFTEYSRLDGRGKDRNWAAFVLADYQITQPIKEEPYRGIFVGGTVLTAPDGVNAYKRSFEGRVYAIGLLPGRPTDEMTITVDYNQFSRSGGQALERLGQITHKGQFSVGALYAFHAMHGLFLSPSIAYIRNPSFLGDYKPAVNLTTSAAILF